MRTKSLCLNPSLEKQPELLRCFHSVFGKHATRGNNSREGMASARQEEGRCPLGGCLWGLHADLPPAPGPPRAGSGAWATAGPLASPGCRLWPLLLASVSLYYTEPICRAKGTKLLCVTQGNGKAMVCGSSWDWAPTGGPRAQELGA